MGTTHHMFAALQPHFDFVDVIGDGLPRWYTAAGKAVKLLSAKVVDYKYLTSVSRFAVRGLVRRLEAAEPDVVFAVSMSPFLYHLVDRFNIVHIADATFHQMVGYYDAFTAIPPFSARRADRIEGKVIRGSFLSLFPIRWAWQSAITDYGGSPATVMEIAWGANVTKAVTAPRSLPQGELRFVFAGVDWERKGGRIAVETVIELKRRGIACHLDVIGCPADVWTAPVPDHVTFRGFVSRDVRDRLYADATFYILPTKAECFGMSLAEAVHHGLPSLSYDTGGLGSVIRNGQTGILMPPGAPAARFADAVCALIAEPERYGAMSAAALADARNRLNWDAWGTGVKAAVAARLSKAGETAG